MPKFAVESEPHSVHEMRTEKDDDFRGNLVNVASDVSPVNRTSD